MLGFVSKRPAANFNVEYLPAFSRRNSAPGWIFRQNLSVLGRLASWTLRLSYPGINYHCGFDLLLHPRCQDDGSEGTSRDVRRGEKLSRRDRKSGSAGT